LYHFLAAGEIDLVGRVHSGLEASLLLRVVSQRVRAGL
jgi:hypothetical protein